MKKRSKKKLEKPPETTTGDAEDLVSPTSGEGSAPSLSDVLRVHFGLKFRACRVIYAAGVG